MAAEAVRRAAVEAACKLRQESGLLKHRSCEVDHDLMNLPWRRKPLLTGEALVDEARRLGVSLEGLPPGPLTLPPGRAAFYSFLDPSNEPEIQSRVLAARNERRSAVLSVAQTAGIIITLLLTLGLALWNGHRESKRESGDMMIKFSDLLDSGQSKLIETALTMNGNLNNIKLSGEALDEAIDDFLSTYDLLDAAYRNGLIDEDMADDAFSYDLEKALRDPKVRQYLSDNLAEESDLYSGVFALAAAWKLTYPVILPAHTRPIASVTPTPGARH
jgi:hypothetical protein